MSSEPSEKRSKIPAKLGYWKIRGLAQAIRLLLKYTGTEFENVLYEQEDAPGYSREAWTSVKFTLGLDFPNLPYFIDGDLKMTQSKAIIHHIARKHNLCGKTEVERAMVEMVEGVVEEVRSHFTRTCYNPKFAEIRDEFVQSVPTKLKQLSDFLGDKKWFIGEEITYVDFFAYEVFDVLRIFESSIFDSCPGLIGFCDRVEALPAIKQYLESPEFIKRPINNPIAQWK